MKIGFIDVTATVSFGGVQTAIWELARALHDMGHEISVIGGHGNIRPDLQGREIKIATFPFTAREKILDLGSRFKRFGERWSFANHALSYVAEAQFDWVILTKPLDFFWPWRMPKNSTTKFCFMSGGTSFMAFDRKLGKKVDAWVACSHFNAWQIAHHYKKFPAVIFNGVDIARFSPKPQKREITRENLGIRSQDTVFAFAGRIVGWKGLAVAIQALAMIPEDSRSNAKLLIIGQGEQKSQLQALVNSLAINNQVIFHPPVPHTELPDLYAASDIGIFPSIADEAFGITIAEAMSCGLPVIASNIGGIPEVVGNEGNAGILVPPANTQALATAMQTMLINGNEKNEMMGQAAMLRVHNCFTWKLSATRLLAVLASKKFS